ncbi:MAG: 30S ribosomal protein S17 [Bacteroidota bacterium]|nr:30S ribosomal protein S17 [Candidatus Kapabacteria bacterium]MCS7302349.1 30S ribosomal protein S17 [Candidatus Kapabacteria bacterium]MCX7936906.1 30S ribosomal protein S17 [Chlorobiota bacterium]MDW8075315.1 30S ribosomal protein S17 [Bacteroidota bacterium]MDW8271927.1 30S ribosomal protein S17 [Bacteroidota bacterium]
MATPTSTQSRRKIRQGVVISNKMDKTIVVAVERQVMHPLYKRYYKRTKKYMAHDEHNQCSIGDIVRIIESRPLSRRKRWMLLEIVQRVR